jgi:hypothetical protein
MRIVVVTLMGNKLTHKLVSAQSMKNFPFNCDDTIEHFMSHESLIFYIISTIVARILLCLGYSTLLTRYSCRGLGRSLDMGHNVYIMGPIHSGGTLNTTTNRQANFNYTNIWHFYIALTQAAVTLVAQHEHHYS